tara:strand:+ start:14384 stop:15127 length:744 start_codon:yes stop_codon:yes gene_type:complete
MRIFIISFFLSTSLYAQTNPGIIEARSRLHIGLIYEDFSYEEPGVMTEEGTNGGVELESGILISPNISFSLYGSYWDGRLQYDGSTFGGTPVQVMTGDYLYHLKAKLHFVFGNTVLSTGYAQRFWHNDLIVSYRRETEYQYIPLKLTVYSGRFYYSFEYDHWLEGLNTSYMSDTGGGRRDVELKQNDGKGMGLEIGWIIPASVQTKVYLRAHQWKVDASESAFDGVDNLVEPENETLSLRLGMGIIF